MYKKIKTKNISLKNNLELIFKSYYTGWLSIDFQSKIKFLNGC